MHVAEELNAHVCLKVSFLNKNKLHLQNTLASLRSTFEPFHTFSLSVKTFTINPFEAQLRFSEETASLKPAGVSCRKEKGKAHFIRNIHTYNKTRIHEV